MSSEDPQITSDDPLIQGAPLPEYATSAQQAEAEELPYQPTEEELEEQAQRAAAERAELEALQDNPADKIERNWAEAREAIDAEFARGVNELAIKRDAAHEANNAERLSLLDELD